MAKARIVGKLDASQNLSTSPFTVSGLKGDTFNYSFFIFCDSASTTAGDVDITVNADTGTNYNRYYMRGSTTTASASVVSSQANIDLVNFTRNQSSRNSFAIGSLTGESGSARKISVNHSSGHTPQVYQNDAYWTNTADEATSITFTGTVSASYTWHIVVWEVPRTNLDGWEYVNKLDWSSETAEKSFSSLDGDTDIQYLLDWDGDQDLGIECNNDGGANYIRQFLTNSSGTLSSVNQTVSTIDVNDQSKVVINADSGVDRLSYISSSQTSAGQQFQAGYWWQNTASNLTSLDCTPSASAIGSCKLYRKKLKPSMQTDLYNLPFRTIEEYDVSGDFSAGYTFSGLNGDDYLMLKVEWLGEQTASGSAYLEVQFNSDTGSNYTYQQLYGQSSTAGAGTATETYTALSYNATISVMSGILYIYPKSGEYRPILMDKWTYGENTNAVRANWWLNSADEITSMKVSATNTTAMTGKIRVSAIYA